MDNEEKIAQLGEMARQDPDDPLTFFMLGTELLRAGRYEEAAGALTRSLELNPQQPPAARLLGDAWRRAGRTDAAREAYELAIRLAETTGELQVVKEARAFLRKLDAAPPRMNFCGLHTRRLQSEWMDRPDIHPAAHQRALQGLARINRISRSMAILWPPLQAHMRRDPGRRWTLLDLATGAGDLPVALGLAAGRAGMQLECHACDTSPTALAHAQALADDAGVQLHTFRCDLTREAIDRPYDFITCSLFLHHLRREQAVALLASMQRSVRTCAVINDLNRCALGLALAWIGTRSLSRSPIVHADGPTSVRAAWTPDEV